MESYSIYNISKGERKKAKMKGKKFLAFALATAMLAGGALSVSAAGVSDVFNGNYYAGKYADLKANVGTDEAALLNHAVTNGAKEGRVISPILDVAAYRKAYADLDAAFGDDWNAYVDHYLTYGIKEKRVAGVLFDLVDYANKNADVKAAYGDDYAAIAKHYVTFGINEGRPGGTIVKEASKPAASAPSNNTPAQTPGDTQKPQEPVYPQGDPTLAQHKHAHEDFDWSVIFNEFKLNNGEVASWPDWFIGNVKTPTCTEDGYVEWRCSDPVYREYKDKDGKIYKTEVIGTCDKVMRVVWPKSHKIMYTSNNVFLLAPTCQKEGTAKYTCTSCGLQISETLPKVNHQVEFDKTVAPTGCGKDQYGYDLWKCIFGCGYTEEKEIKKVEHQIATYDIDVVESTCTVAGHATGICSKCGERETKLLALKDHNYWKLDAEGKPMAGTDNEVTRYVDTYKEDDPEGLGKETRCHKEVKLVVCTACGRIDQVDDSAASVPCVDADKNGWCDFCNHKMDRNHTNQVMPYVVGGVLSDKVGQ